MKWLLQRVLAGLAAVAVVVAGAGVLLGAQFSGAPEPWAASQGTDAVWLGDPGGLDALEPVLAGGSVTEVYAYAGRIDAEGAVAAEDLGGLLERMGSHFPDVRVLAWLRHVESGSSLVRDRFDARARERLAAAAAEVQRAGFDGVHLEVRPVTVNDPSLPLLVELVRQELDEDAVLSVQAQHVELVPGGRVPSFALSREEKYWSQGYLARVVEHADAVVLPGHGSGMPTSTLYGGFMVRQTTESLSALRYRWSRGELAVRFGVPAHAGGRWGPAPAAESAETALEAVRLGLSRALSQQEMGELRPGVALYLGDEADDADRAAYAEGWLTP